MTKKLTFCSMMTVLGVVTLVLSNFLQTTTLFLYLFSTLFSYICVEEHGVKFGLLTATATGLLGFILVADKVSIGAYIIIACYYPVIKHVVEHTNINKILKWCLKLLYALITATVAFFVLGQFVALNINFAVIYVVGIIIFAIYDKALDLGIRFYVLRLRKG